MLVVDQIDPCRRAICELQRNGSTVGLVPTMGALHEGHLSLIRHAALQCDATAVSLFVNPTQFGPNEDLDAYPKQLEKDLAACEEAGVSIVFTPSTETMYPGEQRTVVHVAGLTDGLCGPFRPGHFDGVATIVAKLFGILPADLAFFGEKDFQQLRVIQEMVADLNLSIGIVGCPIVREADGMAMSSRNAYLSVDERRQAASISAALFAAADEVAGGSHVASGLVEGIKSTIAAAGPCEFDYVEVVDAVSLTPLREIQSTARICVAVRIGSCRLIDNVAVDVDSSGG